MWTLADFLNTEIVASWCQLVANRSTEGVKYPPIKRSQRFQKLRKIAHLLACGIFNLNLHRCRSAASDLACLLVRGWRMMFSIADLKRMRIRVQSYRYVINIMWVMIQEKCAKYWPDRDQGPVTYGDVQVLLVAEDDFSFYIQRTFSLTWVSTEDRIHLWHWLMIHLSVSSFVRHSLVASLYITTNITLYSTSFGYGRFRSSISERLCDVRQLNLKTSRQKSVGFKGQWICAVWLMAAGEVPTHAFEFTSIHQMLVELQRITSTAVDRSTNSEMCKNYKFSKK